MSNPTVSANSFDQNRVSPRWSGVLRQGIGIVLFLAWGIETVLWVWTNVRLVLNGDITSGITAVAALGLLILLGGMEGLDWPESPDAAKLRRPVHQSLGGSGVSCGSRSTKQTPVDHSQSDES